MDLSSTDIVGDARMPNSDKAVIVDGIRKTFGSVVAVRDISFDVGRGEVLGLLGPNGAARRRWWTSCRR